MQLRYFHLKPGDKPITTVAEYKDAEDKFRESFQKRLALNYKTLSMADDDPNLDRLLDELDVLEAEEDTLEDVLLRGRPSVLISRCPYCDTLIWMRVGIFSLTDRFWYTEYNDGGIEEVEETSRCPHLFCVDGALGLNKHQPTEAQSPPWIVTNDRIVMAAGVPFVKPRVLNLPTMIAVLHSFPVADKYTAYPVVYFAEQRPSQSEFCVGWARQEYFDWLAGHNRMAVVTGTRTDKQDYELTHWVKQRKLLWLDPDDEAHPLVRGSVESFPYKGIEGRHHPYYIKDGQVFDLPDPDDSEPKFHLEDQR